MTSFDDELTNASPIPASQIPDRRRADRRAADRQGKYDRRKNRCGRCQLFDPLKQFCLHQQTPMRFDDFACPAFNALD